jgi:hypothetical protein
MKTFLTVLVLVCSQISFANTQQATMTSFDLHPERFENAVNTAKISIDEENATVELAVRFIGAQRPLISDEVITLPLIEKYTGDCGTTVYVAQKPSRVIGAPVETVVITDFSTIVCRMKVPADQMTKVQHGEIIKGESEELINESVFAGEVLK